jgi:hypothetical protein
MLSWTKSSARLILRTDDAGILAHLRRNHVGLRGGNRSLAPSLLCLLQNFPDCAPNQQDGQCGLASFMDLLYAAGFVTVLWIAVAIFLSRYLLKRFGGNRDRVVIGK